MEEFSEETIDGDHVLLDGRGVGLAPIDAISGVFITDDIHLEAIRISLPKVKDKRHNSDREKKGEVVYGSRTVKS